MKAILIGISVFCAVMFSPQLGNCLQVNDFSPFKKIKILTFKVYASPAAVREAFLKDEDILHLVHEGDILVVYTEINVSDDAIVRKLKSSLKGNFELAESVNADKNPKLFNR